MVFGLIPIGFVRFQLEWAGNGFELMAKDMRTQPTSPNSIPASAGRNSQKKMAAGLRRKPAAAARQPFFLKNPACRDVGMEFGDVGCVRISFAINSNPFPAHSDWKSNKSYWNQSKNHIMTYAAYLIWVRMSINVVYAVPPCPPRTEGSPWPHEKAQSDVPQKMFCFLVLC